MTTPNNSNNNSPAAKARASARAALECKNKKVDPSCTECTDIPPVRAIILYPNIGTPLIVPPGEKKLNFFIAAESKSKELFGVTKPLFNSYPAPAVLGYMYVDKHLRVYPISEKKTKEDTKTGRLWNDGKVCTTAFEHVKVWCLGALHTGTIKDIDGNIFANIRPGTIEQYNGIEAAHPDPKDPISGNDALAWIYQIQIDLDHLPNKPAAGEIASLAWMVALPESYKKQKELSGLNDWEYQDKLIYDFLEGQKKNPKKAHFTDLYQFNLKPGVVPKTLPEQTKTLSHRLMSWHPITIGKNDKLCVGHLSDVHINARHFALAKSSAQVIEGISPTLGSRIDISFSALKNLFEQMKKEGADALFVTGDLLDFNRNIDPSQVGNDVKDQWAKFDVATNIKNNALYKRGIDDMLMYSLLRYSYEQLQLPVFVTTGNHEAYDIPYGISPRTNTKTYVTGTGEMINAIDKAQSNQENMDARKKLSLSAFATMPPVAAVLGANEIKNAAILSAYEKSDINAYTHGKANEGIPADHNLTVYEACLVYGPTYAQALTSQNFTPDNYDWFFTLFTPLADFAISYKTQCLIGLDWGQNENYINLKGKLSPLNGDFQGLGILPRAVESISNAQKELLESAFYLRKPKPASTLLFSHFTFINFSMGVPFHKSGKPNIVEHTVGEFNHYNHGSCEKHQEWLYDACINECVHYHFSGHSHRAGVYSVSQKSESKPKIRTIAAFDPAIEPNHSANRIGGGTKLIVSSCGGPIGVQNHNNELFGFNLQIPSGTLLNEKASPPIKAIQVDTNKVPFAKPRLCVALDYLWVIWEMSDGKEAEEPIQFHNPSQVAMKPITGLMPDYFAVRLGSKIAALDCIKEIHFWIYLEVDKSDRSNKLHGWKKIEMKLDENLSIELKEKNYRYALRFRDETQKVVLDDVLVSITRTHKPMMFCEVTLQSPRGVAVRHYHWQDKWYFRAELIKSAAAHWMVCRPRRERGEIPNWEWLRRTYPDKYSFEKRETSTENGQ